jgi:hypothetical protein
MYAATARAPPEEGAVCLEEAAKIRPGETARAPGDAAADPGRGRGGAGAGVRVAGLALDRGGSRVGSAGLAFLAPEESGAIGWRLSAVLKSANRASP